MPSRPVTRSRTSERTRPHGTCAGRDVKSANSNSASGHTRLMSSRLPRASARTPRFGECSSAHSTSTRTSLSILRGAGADSDPMDRGERSPRDREVSGVTGDLDLRTVLLLLVAVGALVAAWYVARSAPRLVVAGWAAVCFFVPIWVGVQAGVYWSAADGVTVVALAAWSTDDLHVLVRRRARGRLRPARARRVPRRRLDLGSRAHRPVRMARAVRLGAVRAGARRGPSGCTRASPSPRPPPPCSASSSSPPASTPSSGSPCRTAHGAPGTNCSRGAGSSEPRAPSATRSPSPAPWR